MKHKIYHLTFLVTLVLAALLVGVLPARAEGKAAKLPPAPTHITIISSAPVDMGAPIMLSARLTDAKGKPVSDRAVNFFIDLNYLGQGRTDSLGLVSQEFTRDLAAGEHLLTVRFSGTRELAPSLQTKKLRILPSVFKVQTVPPLAGVTFKIDGREFVSGSDGIAQIDMYKVGRYTLEADIEKFESEDTRIEFGRWQMESFDTTREVDIPSDEPVQAGINVYHRIGQTFVDLDGKPVDMKRISKITIRSIHGDVFTYTNGDMRWIPASRVARRPTGLEVTPLQYSVMNVTVDGSNVVNQAQQKFMVKPDEVYRVQLLLYSMHISTHDGLFGSPVGTHVRVDYPNGVVQTYKLDPTGKVEIHSLARGIYRIQVLGVSGMISPTPVALSRNQEVALKVLTNVDMVMAGVAGLIVAAGLLFIGRPELLHSSLRRRQADTQELEPQADGYVTFHNN
jgi:hypothetical protein